MAKIDFSYHRPGWKTCGKTQEYLAEAEIETKTEINAKKETLKFEDAKELIAKANKLYVAKGKKITTIDLKKESPDDETLQKLVLGPTGNLRAPTLVKGKNLIIGFNEEMYGDVFG